jgi:hypothetical protein
MQAFMRVRKSLCIVLLATQLFTACTSWKVESAPLPERYQADPPSKVRLWLKGGSQAEIHGSRWVNDSVAGTLFALNPKDTTGTRQSGSRSASPRPTSFRRRQPARHGKTIGLAVIGGDRRFGRQGGIGLRSKAGGRAFIS